jgi:hypothetical protein
MAQSWGSSADCEVAPEVVIMLLLDDIIKAKAEVAFDGTLGSVHCCDVWGLEAPSSGISAVFGERLDLPIDATINS